MDRIHIPLYKRLYEDIKEKILNKEFKKNTKLESVRGLSNRLGISTTTVEKAYNQLLIEGYVTSLPRSGYIVLDIIEVEQKPNHSNIKPIEYKRFSNNQLTSDLFDVKSYKSIINKVINYDSELLFTECDPRGELELREEIRKYVLIERDVKCDVNQIIIGPGIQYLLHILLSLQKLKSISYLTPEFKKAIDVFRAYDYTLKPRQSINEILRIKADFLFISPSNIYPTGEVLKVKDRTKIIKWAQDNNSYIIEDDYNFFIRYNSYTIPSIYSYDQNGNVIYMGSFSKTIIPSIRISYMILPRKLYELYQSSYQIYAQGASKLEQLSLAYFMKDGLFKRHTKKLYNLYKEKNDIILRELIKYKDKHFFTIKGTDSNLHVVLNFTEQKDMNTFIKNCKRYELHYDEIANTSSIIFPYSGIENSEIPNLIKDLFYSI